MEQTISLLAALALLLLASGNLAVGFQRDPALDTALLARAQPVQVGSVLHCNHWAVPLADGVSYGDVRLLCQSLSESR